MIRQKKQLRPPVSENLLGLPCHHTFERWRGFMMCSQPMCAALSNLDGTALTKEESRALRVQLDKEEAQRQREHQPGEPS